jgi:hypothetical protein
MKRDFHNARLLAFLVPAFLAAGGCSGSTGYTTAPIDETPAAATSTTCFTPSTAAQNVALPNTAGFTGSLNVGAFPAAGTSCDVTIAFATGSAAAAPAAIQRAAAAAGTRHEAAGSTPTPLLSIAISNAFTNNVIITGAVLNTPPNLTFPNGTYYAIVSSGGGILSSTVLVFTATNGVLTLASTGTALVVYPGSTATLYLYPRGVTPPAVAPTPTPSPSPTLAPGATATPTPLPTAVPTATAAATPTPAPTSSATPGAIVASSFTVTPSGCFAFGNTSGVQTFTASGVTNAPTGTVFIYAWFTNISPFTLTVPGPPPATNVAYTYSYQPTVTVTSPNFPLPISGITGVGVQLIGYLNTVNPINGPPVPVTFASGGPATATVNLEGGTNTCP